MILLKTGLYVSGLNQEMVLIQRQYLSKVVLYSTLFYHLQTGDEIAYAGNHWDGFSMGWNLRTDQKALFPTYKTVNRIKRAKMPTYPEVKENSDSREEVDDWQLTKIH